MATTGEKGTTTHRRRWWLTVPLALALAVGLGALWWFRPWAQVEVPPASASPTEVVRAYVDADAARDADALAALETGDRPPRSRFEVLTSRTEFRDVTIGAARPYDERDSLAEDWKQAMYVPVEMTVVHGAGEGFSDGRTPWGYILVRNADDEPWRILDQGMA